MIPANLAVTTLVCFVLFRTRGCGCGGHPAFPTPSVFSGASFMHNSGALRRGNAEVCCERTRHTLSVIPANAGTKIHRRLLEQKALASRAHQRQAQVMGRVRRRDLRFAPPLPSSLRTQGPIPTGGVGTQRWPPCLNASPRRMALNLRGDEETLRTRTAATGSTAGARRARSPAYRRGRNRPARADRLAQNRSARGRFFRNSAALVP